MALSLDRQFTDKLARYAQLSAAAGHTVHTERVPELLDRIVEFYRPSAIYLFGSFARGDFNEHSDLDFYIVVPDDAEPERRDGLYARVCRRGTHIPMDFILGTESSFRHRSTQEWRLDHLIAQEGQLLYAR